MHGRSSNCSPNGSTYTLVTYFQNISCFQIYQLISLVKKLIDFLFLKIQSTLFLRWHELGGLLCLCERQNTLQLPVFFFFLNSANLIRNIAEFHAKNYFTDHQTAKTIPLFVPIKRKLFASILFQNKSQRKGIPSRLLDRYSHLFVSISLK